VVADRTARRAGDDKIALSAKHIGGERAAHGLKRPLDTVPVCRRCEVALCPFGESAEVVLDLASGKRLEPGAQSDLARKGQACQTDQFLVLDEDAVQRNLPARR